MCLKISTCKVHEQKCTTKSRRKNYVASLKNMHKANKSSRKCKKNCQTLFLTKHITVLTAITAVVVVSHSTSVVNAYVMKPAFTITAAFRPLDNATTHQPLCRLIRQTQIADATVYSTVNLQLVSYLSCSVLGAY